MNDKVLESKKATINEIATKIKDAQTVLLFEYQGLSVKAFEDLRNQLRSEGVDVKIYKNRLAKLALKETGHEELSSELIGPNALAFSNDDAVAGPRIVSKFAKENEAIKIKNGIVEGKVVGNETINELASLPSREGLLSMLLSCLQAPARDMALAVDAMVKKMEENSLETAKDLLNLKESTNEN